MFSDRKGNVFQDGSLTSKESLGPNAGTKMNEKLTQESEVMSPLLRPS